MKRYGKQAATLLAVFTWLASLPGCSEDAPPPAVETTPAAAVPAGETGLQITKPRVDFTTYHATGELPCKTSAAEPLEQCDFGVRRESGGNAIVTITKPDGSSRTITFENGEPTGYDMNPGDPGDFAGSADGGLFVVTIGPERYEIRDIVVFGD